FSNTSKVMVDVRNSSPLLYLPFDKLMQQALQDPAVPRPPPRRPPPPPAARRRRLQSPLRRLSRAVVKICARAIATRGRGYREADEQNRCRCDRTGAGGSGRARQHVYCRSAPVRDRVSAG